MASIEFRVRLAWFNFGLKVFAYVKSLYSLRLVPDAEHTILVPAIFNTRHFNRYTSICRLCKEKLRNAPSSYSSTARWQCPGLYNEGSLFLYHNF